MKTLKQLVEELGLKPDEAEIDCRLKTKNGYSTVVVKNGIYFTIYPNSKQNERLINNGYSLYKVRG